MTVDHLKKLLEKCAPEAEVLVYAEGREVVLVENLFKDPIPLAQVFGNPAGVVVGFLRRMTP